MIGQGPCKSLANIGCLFDINLMGLKFVPLCAFFPDDSPSVFSFFLPEYQPGGWATKADIVSPEAQVLTGRRVTTMIDSMLVCTVLSLFFLHSLLLQLMVQNIYFLHM